MALAQRRTKKVIPKDPAYRDQLITEYLPYVKRIVQRLIKEMLDICLVR